jgi:probable rRNA maturation factor
MTVTLDIEDDAWSGVADLDMLAEAAARAALPVGDARNIALLFTSDEAVQALNLQWRGMDRPTNVLSFPAAAMALPDGEEVPLGDIALAHGTIAREASEQGKTLPHHTTHLIVHGILHLLGHDHESDADADIMENLERDILATLGIGDPYTS